MKVADYLATEHVPFERLAHAPTYSAQRMAQALHVPGAEVAKSVLLRAGRGYVVAVLPATHQVDIAAVRRALNTERVEFATELEFSDCFPDCEVGALPPFGSRYGMRTLVDESLTLDEEIVFEGNSHEEAIRVKYRDYERLERPLVAAFARHP